MIRLQVGNRRLRFCNRGIGRLSRNELVERHECIPFNKPQVALQFFLMIKILKKLHGGVLILCAFFLVSCLGSGQSTTTDDPDDLDGRIMLWHSWQGVEGEILQTAIADFQRVHPNVTIVVVQLGEEEILTRYQDTAALGLGPDILVGSSTWLPALRQNETIGILDESSVPAGRFLPTALDMGKEADRFFGLPLTIDTPVLFYRSDQVEEVAQTFEELLQQATNGQTVAISTGAEDAFLGIQAFGRPIVDTTGEIMMLQADGLVEWLTWLQEAQENPNVILSRDREVLARLFLDGKVTYYIGSFADLRRFRESEVEGEESDIAVALLPSGPFSLARPLLQGDLLYFNAASSSDQRQLALTLAEFLTNEEQNNALLREAGLVPANQRVRVNSRVYPEIFPFVQSGRTAAVVPRTLRLFLIGESADAIYTAVLAGVEEPLEAFCGWQAEVLTELSTPIEGDPACDGG